MALRIPKRWQAVTDALVEGKLINDITSSAEMSRVMTVLLAEVGLDWRHCVALCYVSRFEAFGVEDSSLIEPSSAQDPLATFLAAKDAELNQLEMLRSNLKSRIPKGKAAQA